MATALESVGLVPDSLWGNDEETDVYAQVIWKGKPVIFQFHLDPNTPTQALASRVVNFYHGNEDPAAPSGFKDKSTLRNTIWETVASVSSSLADAPPTAPGTVIDITDVDGVAVGRPHCHPMFKDYLHILRGICPEELIPQGDHGDVPTVDMASVSIISALGGKGCSKAVRIDGNQDSSSTMVFKGIDFATYLLNVDEDGDAILAAVNEWKNESRIIATTPPHPHIQTPPTMLLTVQDAEGGEPVYMGHLSPFLSNGDLAAIIEEETAAKRLIPLQRKKKWCLHMAKALEYTHHSMHTYHMDVKPGNFLVDNADNLRLIDWEQSGAPATTLAPEADGTWDVCDVGGRLVYTKYMGPERRNMPEGRGQQPFQIWNVFPVWQASCPRATELAEVFSVGRTMWMLLTQTIGNFDDVEHPNDVTIRWPDTGEIPLAWIGHVMKCMANDPNDRPDFTNVVKFWEGEQTKTD